MAQSLWSPLVGLLGCCWVLPDQFSLRVIWKERIWLFLRGDLMCGVLVWQGVIFKCRYGLLFTPLFKISLCHLFYENGMRWLSLILMSTRASWDGILHCEANSSWIVMEAQSANPGGIIRDGEVKCFILSGRAGVCSVNKHSCLHHDKGFMRHITWIWSRLWWKDILCAIRWAWELAQCRGSSPWMEAKENFLGPPLYLLNEMEEVIDLECLVRPCAQKC